MSSIHPRGRLAVLIVGCATAAMVFAPAMAPAAPGGNGKGNGNAYGPPTTAGGGNPHAPGATGNPHDSGTTGNPHTGAPPYGRALGQSSDSGLGSSTAAAAAPGEGNDGNPSKPPGKTTICHHTNSDTNPYVEITVSDSALKAHAKHGDIVPAPAGGCEDAGEGLAGAGSGGTGSAEGDGAGTASATASGGAAGAAEDLGDPLNGGRSLPFTGIALRGLLVVGLTLLGLGLAARLASREAPAG
jgi:hypothetical protein